MLIRSDGHPNVVRYFLKVNNNSNDDNNNYYNNNNINFKLL